MRRIDLQHDIKPITEFRAKAATLIDRVRRTRRALVLTQRGRSAAVLIDVREYQRLTEELDLLKEIHMAERQISEGRGTDHAHARDQVLQDFEE